MSEFPAAPAGKVDGAPPTFNSFVDRFPEFREAHALIGKAADAAGPLDARGLALVKLGMCIGAGLETAYRSHVRRALEAGVSWAEIEHAIVQAVNTLGLPRTVMAWQWARQENERVAGKR